MCILILCPQVYNADGEFLFKFGSHGEGNGQFNAPTGVAVDINGNIIVADWGNSRIQVSAVDCYYNYYCTTITSYYHYYYYCFYNYYYNFYVC